MTVEGRLLESVDALFSDMSQANGGAILPQIHHQLRQRAPRLILKLKMTGDYQFERGQANEMLSQTRLVTLRRLFLLAFVSTDPGFKMATTTPQAQAAELKEKLLRDKIKKMRKTSIESRDKPSC